MIWRPDHRLRRKWGAVRNAYRQLCGKSKVVVCTAVTGSYDVLHPPATKVPGWDYICFTDEPELARPGWEVRALLENHLDRPRCSRLPKILAHRFLYDYDISIWVDANLRIIGDLADLCPLALAYADIAFFRHGSRRPSVAAEIEACVAYNKAPFEVMSQQYEHYRGKGFPDDAGIIPEGGVIIRRHNRLRVQAAMEEWWAELLRHSARDQISLPYVIWRNSLRVTLLDWDIRECPWFSISPHQQMTQISN
jgi:hypothetical protein